MTELTCWEDVNTPLFNIFCCDIETWGDNTSLVDATVEVDNDLTCTTIINDFEFFNVTVLLHQLKELDDDLGGWADDNLTLTTLFSIGDGLEGVCEDRNEDHVVGGAEG